MKLSGIVIVFLSVAFIVAVPITPVNHCGAAEIGAVNSCLPNLAFNKPVIQSTNQFAKTGAEAVDGNRDGDWSNGSVSCTDGEPQAYWQVDLETLSAIEEIRLYNRTDCCGDRLSDFDVMLSADGQNWTRWYMAGGGALETIQLNGAVGRYVRIQLHGTNFLSLAEVEVYGLPNLAFGKSVIQSTNQFAKTGAEAVDGNRDGDWSNGSVSCTDREPQAYWQVDLETQSSIDEIRLYNRTDCCSDRLSDFDVMLSSDGENWSAWSVIGGGELETLQLNGAVGRYVRIQLHGTNFLSLAEVEVYGLPNLALGKPVIQSTNQFAKTGAEAVDGNRDGDWSNGSVSFTDREPQAYWQVDLEAQSSIDEIRLYNRTDCCSDRLSDFDVMLSSDGENWSAWYVTGGGELETLQLNGAVGRYVRIQLHGINFLSLAEVEVYGSPNCDSPE